MKPLSSKEMENKINAFLKKGGEIYIKEEMPDTVSELSDEEKKLILMMILGRCGRC